MGNSAAFAMLALKQLGKQTNAFFVAFSQFVPFAVPFLFPAMHGNALFGNISWELDNMGLGSMGTLSLLSLLFSSLVSVPFSFLFPSMHGNVLFENIYWELDDMGLGGGGGGRKGVDRELVCDASV
jgi:hypothetical protein